MKSFRKKGRVSLWIGSKVVDPEIDLLEILCGVDYYDLDDQEINLDPKLRKRLPITALLKPLSYSSSFIADALLAAKDKGITHGLYVICQFDFAYNPTKTTRRVADDPVFLGHFPWNDDEDDESLQ